MYPFIYIQTLYLFCIFSRFLHVFLYLYVSKYIMEVSRSSLKTCLDICSWSLCVSRITWMDADCGLAPLGPSMCHSGVSCWLISLRVFFTPQRHSMNFLLFSLKTHPVWSSCLFTTARSQVFPALPQICNLMSLLPKLWDGRHTPPSLVFN